MSPPSSAIPTGIAYEPVAPGFVTEMEQRDTAVEMAIPWGKWEAMPREEKVRTIAYRRTKRLVSLHQQAAVEREQKERDALSRAKRGKRG